MKKIYYIPGIFSIIFLPILGIWYMNKYDYFTQLRSIDFTYMDFAEIERMTKKYDHVNYGQNEFEMRTYKEVHLSNDKNSKNTFKYIDQFVNDVVQTKDTINGLKIHFEENATYNEFIEVLNIFNEREAELYILDNNTMYFVGRDWDPNAKESEFDNLPFFTCTNGYDYENTSDLDLFIKNFKEQFSQNKIIYIAYIIFFFITIVSIFLKNKKLPK
ncbi:hypothetical protein NU10_07640 [Flavobacterium dauae]|uniref:hypothetical protein n=1 Tax=Flavobacterium dauae TaxID=1563479 RepID=UPI00101B2660|nr:hypothetical protein [Flavobacterium dauae]WLD22612.1 hypothetical protein NU10_07640 [Flavobacterium dauae]